MAQALTFQEELIIQLKAGDQKAFGTLYRSYSNAFLSIIKQIIHDDSELAKDILQDAMVKIWNNMAQYDASKGTLFTWTMNICRNVAIDKTRSKDFKNQAKNKSLDASPETSSRHSSIQPMPELIGVRKMLEVLDPNHREVVDAVYMLGYSHAEAAELLKIPIGTVKTRIRNAIIELRKRYQHL